MRAYESVLLEIGHPYFFSSLLPSCAEAGMVAQRGLFFSPPPPFSSVGQVTSTFFPEGQSTGKAALFAFA